MKSIKGWTNDKVARVHRAEKSDSVPTEEGARRTDAVAVMDRIGSDANSPAWKRVMESNILEEKCREWLEGRELAVLTKPLSYTKLLLLGSNDHSYFPGMVEPDPVWLWTRDQS